MKVGDTIAKGTNLLVDGVTYPVVKDTLVTPFSIYYAGICKASEKLHYTDKSHSFEWYMFKALDIIDYGK